MQALAQIDMSPFKFLLTRRVKKTQIQAPSHQHSPPGGCFPLGESRKRQAARRDATTRWTGGGAVWFLEGIPAGGPGVFRGSPCATTGSERNSEAQRRADYKDQETVPESRSWVWQPWAYVWRISKGRITTATCYLTFQVRVNPGKAKRNPLNLFFFPPACENSDSGLVKPVRSKVR